MMDKKTIEILKAGWAMFARYGFAKTTMSDIATEAGVSRQTLYNAFSNKEDVLRAVVRHAGEESLATVKDEWAKVRTLDDKLATFHTHGPIAWYKAMITAPDWGELMDGMHKASSDELDALERKWVAELERVFKDNAPDKCAASADELARFFYSTSKNAKYGVKDVSDLKARLKTILQATLALANT